VHTPCAHTHPLCTRYRYLFLSGSLTTMSCRQQLQRVAAQLHTAVADARAIAAQRETVSDPIQATDVDAVEQPAMSELISRQTPLRRARMSLSRPTESDLRFDPSVPQPARVYAYWLGGKDHYSADRVAAEEVIARRPQVVAGARANRAFLARVVRFLVTECGIRQFLDIGTGLPAPENTHEVAQAIAPGCRVVYVDNDPLVLVHARALLTSTPLGSCDYLEADLRDVRTVLTGAAGTLDLTRPAAVLLLAVLHFITDTDDPAAIVAALARQLAPGSYVVISHLTGDFAPDPVLAGVKAYNTLVPATLVPRNHSQVSALFAGLPMVPPGVVPLTERRSVPAGQSSLSADPYAGMAHTAISRRRVAT
jgi:SAM-dependent methyltransferase